MPRALFTSVLRSIVVSRLPVQKWMPCSERPDAHQKPPIQLSRISHPRDWWPSMPPV